MNNKKEIWFIGIGLAAGGFITIFSNFFEYILTPFFPDPRSIVFVKTLSGVLAIVCGLGILKWYSRHPPKKINDDESESLTKVEDKIPQSNNHLSEPKKSDNQKGSNKFLKHPLGIGLITLSIIELMIILIPYDYSKISFDYKLFTDIVLVAIPIGGGAVASRWITNAWQVRSAKIRMKQESLLNFQNAIKLRLTLLDSFCLKIADHYADYHTLDRLPTSGKIDITYSTFPDQTEKQPLKLFGNEYAEIYKKLDQTRIDSSKFISNLRLFYNDEELEQEYQTIGRHSKHLVYVVEILLNSSNLTNFIGNLKEFEVKKKELKQLVTIFEKKLVDTKLDIPKF